MDKAREFLNVFPDKMKTFWEYLDEEIGKKPYKAIKKSVNIKKYELAIRLIGSY